jgi:hypothetical protein
VTLRCDQIQASAAGIAALAPSDPERRAAEAHALVCAACAAALAEARAVLALVDRALPLEAPRPEAMARARAEILREMSSPGAPARTGHTARRLPAPRAIAVVLAVLAGCWLLPMIKHFNAGMPVVVSAALAVMAAAAGAAALTWGGRTLLLLPLLSLALAVFDGGSGGLQVSAGVRCVVFELGLALAPLAAAFQLARKGRLGGGRGAVAAAAGAGALVGQAVLHVACHASPSLVHGLVFHTLPVLVALGAGALLGARLPPAPAGVE